MARYWVAHVRGAEYDYLKKHGFLVFYPALDDYVFLEVKPENEKFLRKQAEFQIAFLKRKGKDLVTVSEAEILRMRKETRDSLEIGVCIEVVSGFAANMKGKVAEIVGDKYKCILNGWKRKYEVCLSRTELAVASREKLSESIVA